MHFKERLFWISRTCVVMATCVRVCMYTHIPCFLKIIHAVFHFYSHYMIKKKNNLKQFHVVVKNPLIYLYIYLYMYTFTYLLL